MAKKPKKPLIPQTKNTAKPKAAAKPSQAQIDMAGATDIELQAAAYRETLLAQRCQMNIQAINQELAQRAQQGRAVVRPKENEK